jgi:predicted phage tail protein
MISVTHYRNPIDPASRESREIAEPATLWGLTKEFTQADEWPLPTVAIVNGDAWMRARWSEALPDGAVVEFRSFVQGGKTGGYVIGGAMIVAGAAMIISSWGTLGPSGIGLILAGAGQIYAASQMIDPPDVPSYLGADAGSPTYSIAYKSNRKRVGEPVPVVYGKHRLLPDLVTESYQVYVNDQQFAYIVICLGIGEFDIDASSLRFGEALFSELKDITYQVVPPGSALTLFRDRVTTNQSLSGQEVIGIGSPVKRVGGPVLTVTWDGVSGDSIIISCSDPVFSNLNIFDVLQLSGTINFDGHGNVVEVSANAVRIDGYFTYYADEFPVYASVSYYLGAAIVSPQSAVFTTGPNRITSVAGAFSLVQATDSITVSNAAPNNGTFTVTAVAGDGSWIQTATAFTPTTAPNPQVVHTSSGWSPWYEVANKAVSVESFEVDYVCPRGIGTLTGAGGVNPRTITTYIEYQGWDVNDILSSAPQTLTTTLTGAQVKPLRRSYKFANDTGYPRVKIRYRRSALASTNTNDLDTLLLAGLKGYLPNVTYYPGCTVMAIKVRASEQMVQGQTQQVNLVATRKLPIWNGTSWSANTATRSPAWALTDILRDACQLNDSEIDLPAFLALDAIWAGRGDSFDGVFDQTLTSWEALQRVARAGRAQVVLSGGVVTIVRDGVRSVRAAMFTPSNILAGSLRVEYRLPNDNDPDGTSVSWVNPTNNWQAAHIDYRETGGTPVDPVSIDLFGVTGLAQATREAVYLDRVRIYQRKTISWQTEMDGHLVSVGDLVALSHDVPAWGQSGELLAQVGTIFTTSEPLTWAASGTHYVLLRRPTGTVFGPYAVTQISGQPNQFSMATALDFSPRLDLSLGERTGFTFGPSSNYLRDVVITSVTPQDATTVELQAIPYDARVHAAGA